MPIEKIRFYLGHVLASHNEKHYNPLPTSSQASTPNLPSEPPSPCLRPVICTRRSFGSGSHRRKVIITAIFTLVLLFLLLLKPLALIDWRNGGISSVGGDNDGDGMEEEEVIEPMGGVEYHIQTAFAEYKAFDVSTLPTTKSREWMTTLRPNRFLPEAGGCLDQWFEHGTVCQGSARSARRDTNVHSRSGNSFPLGPEEKLDVVYLWVNGTDPIWQETKASRYTSNTNPSTPSKHYRDRNELKYTMRSVAKAFRTSNWGRGSHVRKVHVVTADMPFPMSTNIDNAEGKNDNTSNWRVGQIPSWINPKALSSAGNEGGDVPDLQWHFHSEIFRLPASYLSDDVASNERKNARWSSESEWKELSVPSFNSFGIETMLGWLDDLSDFAVQANDDMFFLSSLSTSDFYSPLYGTVIRLDSALMVRPIRPVIKADGGEWAGLQHASWLLSQRYPDRPRNYIIHAPKTLSLPMLQEVTSIWTDEIALAATRPFRESNNGDGDIENAFLVTHHRIERWREALLWTWVMGKMGAREGGKLGKLAREEVEKVFGTLTGLVEFPVSKEREVLEDLNGSFAKAGWNAPKSTKYHFSSFDGHTSAYVNNPSSSPVCEMDMAICFGSQFLSGEDVDAQEVFKQISFDVWACGDCVIRALITASGTKGLSAFLPTFGTRSKPAAFRNSTTPPPPHLPLTKTWQDTDFSLEAVVLPGSDLLETGPSPDGSVDLRIWAMKLLSRYAYVIGKCDSPVMFQPIRSVSQARSVTAAIEKQTNLAMGCLNDDVPDRMADAVAKVLQNWMEKRWDAGWKVWWERQT